MKSRVRCSVIFVIGAGLVALATTTQGCTIGDTVVHVMPGPESDAGPAAAPNGSGGGGGATCSPGAFTKPDLSKLKACKTHGHCWEKTKMPSGFAAQLAACDDPSQACVPDEVLTAGGGKLKSCSQPDSLKAAVGESGGCITIALIPEMASRGSAFLKRQECDEGQVCAPCKNPEDNGADTPFCQPIGVAETACEGPKTVGGGDGGAPTPTSQQACCTTTGKSNGVCMGSGVLSDSQKDQLPQDVCAETDRCLPAALVKDSATSCNVNFLLGKGVCLDKCFNGLMRVAGFLGILPTEGCGPTEVCAPCSFMKDQAGGKPVPGCD
jgi:hypothetical protein